MTGSKEGVTSVPNESASGPSRRLDVYPKQGPLSEAAEVYAARVLALAEGIEGDEVNYGADVRQTLTVFRPHKPNGIVFLNFHGGGWKHGYKEWMYFMAPAFNAYGITLVSATYRLAPENLFPTAFDDAADAVAWVYRNILPSMASGAHLFVGGHSAGGHHAALLAVTTEWRVERRLPLDLLDGCIPVSGVYRFGDGSGFEMRPQFLGPDMSNDFLASPVRRISDKHIPPFLITYGSRDYPNLMDQAIEMSAALRAESIPVEVELLEGHDHFETNIAASDPTAPWVKKTVAWMRKIASKQRA